MKKEEQIKINKIVISHFEDAMNQLKERPLPVKERLYNCQAYIEKTPEYIILTSYDTAVAVYSKLTGCVYDALRYVYGYTATSAQHIAKFRNWVRENERLYWDQIESIRYYPIG